MLDPVLLAKLGLCAACTAAALFLVPHRRFQQLTDRRFNLEAITLLVSSRLACFIAVFVVAGLAPSSDILVYYDTTRKTLEGQVPFRDFFTAYGPLFNYTASLALLVWNSAKSLILMAVLFEIASIPMWLWIGRRLFPQPTFRTATLLYITSPLPLMVITISGQNHVWIAFFLAASIVLLQRHRNLWSGVMLGMSIVVVKFLSLIFAPGLFLAAPKRVRWTCGLALLPVLAYGALVAMRIDLITQLKFHAQHGTSGNLPYLLSAVGVDFASPLVRHAANLIGLAVLLTVIALPWLKRLSYRGPNTIHLISMLILTLLLVSKKSFPSYTTTCFFALCCSLAPPKPTRRFVLWFSLFGTIAVLESSLWFRWLHQQDLRLLWQQQLPDGTARWQIWFFLVWQIALQIGLFLGLTRAWQALQQNPHTPSRRVG